MRPDTHLRLYRPAIDAPPSEFRGKLRWVYGDTHPVVAPVAENSRVEIGDLVWQPSAEFSVRQAREAALLIDEPYSWDELQRYFVRSFLGVAMQHSPAGEAAAIRVATTGVFTFDSAPDRYRLGTLMGPAMSADISALRDQCVAVVVARDRAIGRVARLEPTARASVLVQIFSRVMSPIVA